MAAYFSSPEIDDSAIDTIISEATDLCTLEQIAALNTAHLSDSFLPTNLETRFRKLKSFPGATNPHPKTPPQPTNQQKENIPESLNRSQSEPNSLEDQNTNQLAKPEVLTPSRATDEPKILEPKSRSGFSSIDSPRESPSPPRQMCCFGCSPKRIQRKKGNGDDRDWEKDNEIFSEFGSFSLKEHRRKLEKAWKKQEKASREAEKLEKWVKQVSARINEAAIDELLDEEFK